MGFMDIEIFRDRVIVLETDQGDIAIPESVAGKMPDLSPSNYKMYVPYGNILSVRLLKEQYIGRFSAAGYMDCTDWHYDTNRKRLERELKESYGD